MRFTLSTYVGMLLALVSAGAVVYIHYLKEEDIIMSRWREVEDWDATSNWSLTDKALSLYDQGADEEIDPKEVEQAVSQLEAMLKEMQR